jgi:hypothetical protein
MTDTDVAAESATLRAARARFDPNEVFTATPLPLESQEDMP